LAELEWTESVRSFQLVQNWISRGLIYVFVGLLALDNDEEDLNYSISEYIFIASLALIALGITYSFLGLLCCKRFKDEKMAKYIQLLSHLEVQNALSRSTSNAEHNNA
jgi:ABC-type lipoprotein release transport system permease subunit